MDKQHGLGRLKIYLIGAVAATVAFGIAVGLLLTDRTPDFRFSVAVGIMAALLSLIAIPVFLTGLHSFKAGLKRSYIFLAIGIGLFGAAQFQIPAVNLTGWWIWLDSGLAGLAYFISVIPMLLGLRMFAKLLQIKTRWSSVWLCLAIAVVTSIALSFLPHAHGGDSELQFHIFIGIVVWSAFVMLFCSMLTLRIRAVIAPTYKKSLLWLAGTFLTLLFAGLHFIVIYFVFTNGDWYFDYSIDVIPFVIGGALFIKAGYEFNSIDYTLSEGDTEALPSGDGQHPQPTALDIITHVASLASSPSDIDAILDDMRIVTSRIEHGQAPEATDDEKLSEVYQRLVVYLTRQDPLRQYTKESIRANLTATFGEHVAFLEKQKV